MSELTALLSDLNALHARGSLHPMDAGNVCMGCGGQWPCRTMRIIDKHALNALQRATSEPERDGDTLQARLESAEQVIQDAYNAWHMDCRQTAIDILGAHLRSAAAARMPGRWNPTDDPERWRQRESCLRSNALNRNEGTS